MNVGKPRRPQDLWYLPWSTRRGPYCHREAQRLPRAVKDAVHAANVPELNCAALSRTTGRSHTERGSWQCISDNVDTAPCHRMNVDPGAIA